MHTKFIAFLLLFMPLASMAQQGSEEETEHDGLFTQMYFDTRFAYEYERLDGNTNNDGSGFRGQYIFFRVDGQIIKGLTYSYRQRLTQRVGGRFFDGTDWLHIDWNSKHWGASAGKVVVGIGGYEYDRAPIDLFYTSEFWNNIPCFQLGVSGSYTPNGKDKFVVQVANSPFRGWAGNNSYAFSGMWYGSHGWYNSIWSVNALQYDRHKWINYIALGNRFEMSRYAALEVDYMNRASKHQDFFKDFSVMAELAVKPHESTRITAKYTYDQNHSGTAADLMVMDGTELHMVSGGVEVEPLKNHRDLLRLFGMAGYSWGENTNPDGVLQDKQFRCQVGAKFRIDLLQGFQWMHSRIANRKNQE